MAEDVEVAECVTEESKKSEDPPESVVEKGSSVKDLNLDPDSSFFNSKNSVSLSSN
jgi:hypothetical protein